MQFDTLSELRAILDGSKSGSPQRQDPARPQTRVSESTKPPVVAARRVQQETSAVNALGVLGEALRAAPTTPPWWLEQGAPENWLANPLSLQTAFVNAACMDALKSGKTLYKGENGGTPTLSPAQVLKLLVKDGWRLALTRCPISKQETHLCADFVRDDGVLVLEMTADDFLYGSYATTNADVAASVEKLLRDNTTTTPPTGSVYALVNQGKGIGLMNLGRVNTPMNPANYAPDVAAAFDRVVADLQTEHPNGRLVILEGPPGTGKSFWVRGMVQATTEATFVLIPPDMVGSLAHPSLLPVLARHRASHDAPVVLILEDAEACLLPRKEGSLQAGAVSTLLNLADGIFGQLLDVRIVATTNTKKVDFDPAFLRPGRLSEVVTFGPLAPEQASSLLKKLVPGIAKDALPTKALPLAEVYQLARKAGWKPPRAEPKGAPQENGLHAAVKRLSAVGEIDA